MPHTILTEPYTGVYFFFVVLVILCKTKVCPVYYAPISSRYCTRYNIQFYYYLNLLTILELLVIVPLKDILPVQCSYSSI